MRELSTVGEGVELSNHTPPSPGPRRRLFMSSPGADSDAARLALSRWGARSQAQRASFHASCA